MNQTKQSMRMAVKAKLAEITDEARAAQSERILQKLLVHPAYARCRSVSVYLSTAAEVDTRPVLEALFASGRACFVPRYHKRVMEMVRLRDMDDYRALPLTRWAIRQPRMDEPRDQPGKDGVPALDLVLVPGVAFTASGARLGHGGGYYDAFLAGLPHPKPTTIALAFREQLVDALPTEEHDVPVDHVLAAF